MLISDIKPHASCFTGHRILQHDFELIHKTITNHITQLYFQGISIFLAGGALGFDTVAATAVLDLKNLYNDVKLILVLPCDNQTRGWNPSDVVKYNDIKSKADHVVYTSHDYTRGCMHKRNRFLVDYSSTCISYQYSQSGGTAYTVKYAASKGIPVFNLFEVLNRKHA